MATISPDPALTEADFDMFEALAERTIANLGRRRGALDVVNVLDEVLVELAPRLADVARLAYLDGAEDGEDEDSDRLLDGADRAARAEARGKLALEALDPVIATFRETHDELLERAALLAGPRRLRP